ncbi:MAG: hypothetical protein NC548_50925 [Lachnospiraceae bacterium]|nr:hypothetical protein [Lachnospiraceae bacterium]
MKKIILFVLTGVAMFALHAKDYREIYKGNVYNFISRGKEARGDGEEGEKSEFVARNAEKILAHANKGRDDGERLFIVQYISGNFTGTGNTEFLISFNEEKYKKDSFFSIRLMRLYSFDKDENIVNSCDVENYTISIVGRRYMNECLPLGKRYSEGWIYDLNRNGKLELIFISGEGLFSGICILEYSEGKFKNLLEVRDEWTKVLDADVESGTLYLERDVWNAEERQYRKVHTKAVWNEESGMYEETELETGRNINEFDSGIG